MEHSIIKSKCIEQIKDIIDKFQAIITDNSISTNYSFEYLQKSLIYLEKAASSISLWKNSPLWSISKAEKTTETQIINEISEEKPINESKEIKELSEQNGDLLESYTLRIPDLSPVRRVRPLSNTNTDNFAIKKNFQTLFKEEKDGEDDSKEKKLKDSKSKLLSTLYELGQRNSSQRSSRFSMKELWQNT